MTATSLTKKTPEEIDSVLGELRRSLEDVYGARLRGLYLYGSYARGDARPGSDVDVLVVLDTVDSYSDEIQRTSQGRAEVALLHDVSVSLVYVSEDAWIRGDLPILQNARREGRAA
jgi:uncharacterized protein